MKGKLIFKKEKMDVHVETCSASRNVSHGSWTELTIRAYSISVINWLYERFNNNDLMKAVFTYKKDGFKITTVVDCVKVRSVQSNVKPASVFVEAKLIGTDWSMTSKKGRKIYDTTPEKVIFT